MQTPKLVQLEPYKGPTPELSDPIQRMKLGEQIKADIDKYCQLAYDDGPRSHLGASEIGHPCERFLWYKFRWFFREEFSGRLLRLFNRGHREEERYHGWLEGISCELLDSTENQIRMEGVAGHFGGSRDGTIRLSRYRNAEPILVEFKTNGTGRGFDGLDEGVEVAKPQHWAQLCVYGVGFNLRYALYLNINKNDDTLHVEIVELDHTHGRAMIEKGRRIISSQSAPPRISENPSWRECSWCAAKQVCHFGAPAMKNCRSCLHASPVEDGMWNCGLWKHVIPTEFLKEGCSSWTENKL